jgi:hypothetical protein
MEISHEAATARGPAETFTGEVFVDPITRGLPASQLNVAAVRFTPGARSAWHSHQGGQGRQQRARTAPRLRDGTPRGRQEPHSQRAGGPAVCYWSPVRTDVMRSVLKPSQCMRPT